MSNPFRGYKWGIQSYALLPYMMDLRNVLHYDRLPTLPASVEEYGSW